MITSTMEARNTRQLSGRSAIVIRPTSVQRACLELQARGQVPCFVATAVENYRDSRVAYGLEDDDILQIAGMMIVPTDSDGEASPAFLMFSVDSELTYGGVA